jgi:predicted N-formylglutamate amidohydrolase
VNAAIVVSCEHGGNRIPRRYRRLFAPHNRLLRSHRGFDAGALRLARAFAGALDAPLFASTVSRLLVDLNRSPASRFLFSTITRALPPGQRTALLDACYWPYRHAVEAAVAGATERGHLVVHLSIHTFAERLRGRLRNADVGLLYDPDRHGEVALCRAWKRQMRAISPAVRVRFNYPYRGTADGLTTHLRRQFPRSAYLGIEVEMNRKFVAAAPATWRTVQTAIIDAFRRAVQGE